jgi:hypothetical protein
MSQASGGGKAMVGGLLGGSAFLGSDPGTTILTSNVAWDREKVTFLAERDSLKRLVGRSGGISSPRQ